MRIVVVCERLQGHGGWYTYARGLVEILKRHGHAVTVVSKAGADGNHLILPSPLDTLGKPWLHPIAGRKLKHLLDSIQPDVIHFVVEPYALLAAFLPRRHRKKCVVTIHGSYGVRVLSDVTIRLQACRVFKRLTHYITVSDYTKDAVAEMLRRKCSRWTCKHFAGRVKVIRNGVTLPPWKPKEKKNLHKHILLVGGVKPRKGVLEALDGLAEFKRNFGPNFTFTVAGVCDDRTAYVNDVRKKIVDLGLSDNVKLVGSVDDAELERLYRDADLYLMPSGTGWNTFEGYGIAFIEANAYGVPCIGPDRGGAAEAIMEGRTGFRVNPKDSKQMAERMHQVLMEHRIHPEDCRAWAEAHGLENRVKEIEELYTLIKKT